MFVENIEVTTLPNGLRVVSETVPHVQSVSVGIWVRVGSRDEEPAIRGITHFIEHMLFKGTSRRTAKQIADQIESLGGSLNAFTDREMTCYYAKALAEHVELVMDVLTDMVRQSLFDSEELGREQNVVLEEIKRSLDTPDDYIHDLFMEQLWSKHPLGRPVIGTQKTVAALNRDTVVQYVGKHYTPDRIVISIAGNIPHTLAVDLAGRFLGDMSGKAPHVKMVPPSSVQTEKRLKRRTEQVHFCYGSTAYSQFDEHRHASMVLDSVLGGNMSSRLFQEIREKRGLAYAIGTYGSAYREGGHFTVYGGTSPQTFEQVLDLTRTEMDKVMAEGLEAEEIAKTKVQIRGRLVLGLENMGSRMMRMGKSMLYHNRVVPLNEVLGNIEAVTQDDVIDVANQLFPVEKMTMTAIGPFKKSVEADA